MSGELSIHLIRAVLRELTAMVAHRAHEEDRIEQEHGSAADAARRRQQEARGEIDGRLEAALKSAKTEHAEAINRIDAAYTRTSTKARRAESVEREKIQEKGEQGQTTAQRMWDEAVWAAETVYEAKEGQPQEAFERTRKALAEQRSALETVREQAGALISRYRMRVPLRPVPPLDDRDGDLSQYQSLLEECCAESKSRLESLGRMKLLWLFQDVVPFALPVIAAAAVVFVMGLNGGWTPRPALIAGGGGALAVSGVIVAWLYARTRRRARALFDPLCADVESGLRAYERCLELAAARRDQDMAELVATRDHEVTQARRKYAPVLAEIAARRRQHLERIEKKYPALHEEQRHQHQQDRREADRRLEAATAEARQRHQQESAELDGLQGEQTREIQQRYEAGWSSLVATWSGGMSRALAEVRRICSATDALFPAWNGAGWAGWEPPQVFAPVIRFGQLAVDLAALPGGLSTDPRLALDGPTSLALPAVLSVPDQCSVLLESGSDGREQAVRTLQTLMMRLLTSLPPGKVRFTIIDPVGLGQNFAGFMHLADYNEALVGGKIWTETRHIEQRLADLTEHMENVIQKYLRNEYETIAQYNDQAGEIAEPYRFVVVCDFPTNVSDAAARRLGSILSSGARCGVYTLISMDTRLELPRGVNRDDMRRQAIRLAHEDGRFVWKDPDFESCALSLDAPPDEAFVTETLKKVGHSAQDAGRVEVPFEVVAPDQDKRWSDVAVRDVRVPLGRAGATRLQELVLGHGTNQHALIAGKTGSGKSTLLHVLITNLALRYSPDQVQLYLVDFKKGVEFKAYATHNLPHARAVAIESDREFGLSVLQRLDDELKRRGEVFRELGAQDLAGYDRAGTGSPMPRTLLIIDEFQEFFVEDDKIAQDAALLLDRLVRQGRAFGIHVLLGSQTLAGAYTLARSTLGQMGVRIALQCSETDSYLILSDDNAAARLLSRPGEAIYNDANGQVEGNSPFQVVWLPEPVRDRSLAEVRRLAEQRGYRRDEPQIVFEGNAPADVAGNHLLESLLEGGAPARDGAAPRAWLGEAVAIKGPTEVTFTRHSGSNLIIAGQRDEAALAMLTTTLVSLAAGLAPGRAAFWIFDGTPADSPRAGALERLADLMPHETRVAGWREVDAGMAAIAAELKRRQDQHETDAPSVFVLVCGLQRFRQLRHSDDFGFSMGDGEKAPAPDKQFADLLREGPAYGMHVVGWCDTAMNLERTFDRQGLREFDHRVLFQMSSTDSTNLIDSPAASRLGIHRAIYCSQERGTLEKFRPYGLPDDQWLAEAMNRITGAHHKDVEVEIFAQQDLANKETMGEEVPDDG